MAWGRLLACTVLVASVAPTTPAAAAAIERISCDACLLVTDEGQVLYERKAHQGRPNASTTKMVTALLVIRALSLRDEVTVSAAAAGVGEGGEDLAPGDHYSVEELLYALLLTSSNDAAIALAEHVSGSEAAFVEAMNAYADELGTTDTNFVTPHGLDRPGHESSAADLVLVAEELLDEPVLARMVRTASITIEGPRGPVALENRNLLLESYRGAIGVKTGFTDDAGNVLVSAAERRGRRLIAVVMGSEDSFADSRRLLDYGWEQLASTVLVSAGRPVAAAVIDPTGAVAVVVAETVTGIGDPDEVRLLFHPRSSDGSGTVDVVIAGRVVDVVPATTSIPELQSELPTGFFAALLRLAARVTGRVA